MKNYIIVLCVLMSMGLMASAVPIVADVTDATLYSGGSHDLTYTVTRIKNTTVVNCTLYDNVAGTFAKASAQDTTITNGTNTFTISPSWPAVGTTKLWNVVCVSNYTKSYKDATNATITFAVYDQQYSTTDLSNMVVDIFGTGVSSGLNWVDMLVLLAVVGVIVSVAAGLFYKGGRIFGLG